MEIEVTEEFLRSVKPIAKRYRSFNQDYQALLDELEKNPHAGIDLGQGYRKVRMAIAAKGKGKSGGARVITLDYIELNGKLYLLYAYDKSDASNIDIGIIKKMVAGMDILSTSDTSENSETT